MDRGSGSSGSSGLRAVERGRKETDAAAKLGLANLWYAIVSSGIMMESLVSDFFASYFSS